MKKITILTMLVGTMATSSLLAVPYADVHTPASGFGPYQTGSGGEFTLIIDGAQAGSGIVAGTGAGSTYSFYDANTRGVGGSGTSFQTFCVEGSEFIAGNTAYDVTTGSATKFEGKTLTVGAAWLYALFASGQLPYYNYSVGSRAATAGDFQQTIWWLMGTEGYTQTLGAAPANAFTTLVEQQFTGNTVFYANVNQYPVAVLKLWSNGDAGAEAMGDKAQDQLVLTGTVGHNLVPDGGMTVALLGFALTGLGLVNRKIRK